MGNFNNGLGHNGGAHGFKISSLNRLADTKAANGLTWLHYVVKYVSLGLQTPDIQLFVDEIEKAAESYRRKSSSIPFVHLPSVADCKTHFIC